MEAEELSSNDLEPEETLEAWQWIPGQYLAGLFTVLATVLLVLRIHHSYKSPPPFGFELMSKLGFLTVSMAWLKTSPVVSRVLIWIYDENSKCDLIVRTNSVCYALVHTFLLCFFVTRLDIVQDPVTFWWDRKRRTYLMTKYSFLFIGFLNPVLVALLLRGRPIRLSDQAFVCTWDLNLSAKTVLPTSMLLQQFVYIAVLLLFIRPIRNILEVVESKVLRQALSQVSFWNTVVIFGELVLLIITASVMNFLDPGAVQHDAITLIGQIDCLLVMTSVVMCLRPPPPLTEPKTQLDKIIHKLNSQPPCDRSTSTRGAFQWTTTKTSSDPLTAPRAVQIGPKEIADVLDALKADSAFTSLMPAPENAPDAAHLKPQAYDSMMRRSGSSSMSRRGLLGSRRSTPLRVVPERHSFSNTATTTTSSSSQTATTTSKTATTTTSSTKCETETSPPANEEYGGFEPQFPNLYREIRSESFGGYDKVLTRLDNLFEDLPEAFNLGRPMRREYPLPGTREGSENEERLRHPPPRKKPRGPRYGEKAKELTHEDGVTLAAKIELEDFLNSSRPQLPLEVAWKIAEERSDEGSLTEDTSGRDPKVDPATTESSRQDKSRLHCEKLQVRRDRKDTATTFTSNSVPKSETQTSPVASFENSSDEFRIAVLPDEAWDE